jgi:hypothetical protein
MPQGVKIEIISMLLGVVVLSPDRMQNIGLRRGEKPAEDVHEPVLYLLQKQNHELSYASEREGKPDTSR